MRRLAPILLLLLLAMPLCRAGDDDAADLRLRIKPSETLHYNWSITSSSSSNGKDAGKPFTLTGAFSFSMTLQLKGLPPKGDGTPLSIRLQNINYTDKHAMGEDAKTDLAVSREKVKYSENGKVIVDSENDIGAEYVNQYLDQLKLLEMAEAHSLVDSSGKQSMMEGDAALIDMFRNGGAHEIFPILAGKSVKPGESWEDNFELPKLGDFKLAKPAIVHAKMTFAKWETRDGKRLAQIDLVSAMERVDLKGENPKGMLAEISHVNNLITGSCLFDPATGHFISGNIDNDVKYHIDGELEKDRVGLDVSGKSSILFGIKEK